MGLTDRDLDQIRGVVREELEPLKKDVGSLKKDVGSLKKDVGSLKKDVGSIKKALVFMADRLPGSAPGRKSYVAREVEKILEIGGQLGMTLIAP